VGHQQPITTFPRRPALPPIDDEIFEPEVGPNAPTVVFCLPECQGLAKRADENIALGETVGGSKELPSTQ